MCVCVHVLLFVLRVVVRSLFRGFVSRGLYNVLGFLFFTTPLVFLYFLSEHLWDELGRRVRNGLNPPETLDELRRALIQEWNNIPQAFIRNLIGSMRRRCQAVINARGGHTRY